MFSTMYNNLHIIMQQIKQSFYKSLFFLFFFSFFPQYVSMDREFIHLELANWCQKAAENNSNAKGLAVWMICNLCPKSTIVHWNFVV